jgi:homogentisate 1,2-dioxygenase
VLERQSAGTFPSKHHLAFPKSTGGLHYEECLTREGFNGPYSILYHLRRPHALLPRATFARPLVAARPEPSPLRRRHFRSQSLSDGLTPRAARIPLLFGDNLAIGVMKPTVNDDCYLINAEGDELLFVLVGRGCVRSVFGDLAFGAGDYVLIPKGVLHRILLEPGPTHVLTIESSSGIGIPRRFRNAVGQLRMDAPYCHRDFRVPQFVGPIDEGIREVCIRRDRADHLFDVPDSPLDVVGWDGSVYPWAFPILNFQPRVSSVHLPPTWHGTFESDSALICSFVPRPLDFHAQAVPCPYPHASVDVDEVLFYAGGNFSSRRGVDAGSLTLHPSGLPHGPHPGRYEESLGTTHTQELAVMLDCMMHLKYTAAAEAIEDAEYERSFHDAS